MGQRIAGICYIKVDGTQLTVEGGVECPVSRTKKEAVEGLSAIAGYKETVMKPYVKLSAIVDADFPRSTLEQNSNMTITAELANGTVYTLTGAWLEGEAAVKVDEGKIDLEFVGLNGVWS